MLKTVELVEKKDQGWAGKLPVYHCVSDSSLRESFNKLCSDYEMFEMDQIADADALDIFPPSIWSLLLTVALCSFAVVPLLLLACGFGSGFGSGGGKGFVAIPDNSEEMLRNWNSEGAAPEDKVYCILPFLSLTSVSHSSGTGMGTGTGRGN